MLSVNTYTRDYIDACRLKVEAQLAAYRNLVTIATTGTGADETAAALGAFAPLFFNNMVLVLDHYFCHRSRMLELKDGNPLNEVRMLSTSIMENDSRMCADKTIKLDPDKSVLKHKTGDEIKVSEADFMRLSIAFFAEIEAKFG